VSAGLGGNGGGVVAANVVEGAEMAVGAADGENGFAGEVGGEVVAGVRDLVGAAYGLPVGAKDVAVFELLDGGIEVPGCRMVCASASWAVSS